jgi:hypothetical protein
MIVQPITRKVGRDQAVDVFAAACVLERRLAEHMQVHVLLLLSLAHSFALVNPPAEVGRSELVADLFQTPDVLGMSVWTTVVRTDILFSVTAVAAACAAFVAIMFLVVRPLAARLTGRSWRDSAALGALMNTRGLMELIVLNIGLDLGVISPTLFAVMVIMALVTIAATSPIVSLLVPRLSERDEASAPQHTTQ